MFTLRAVVKSQSTVKMLLLLLTLFVVGAKCEPSLINEAIDGVLDATRDILKTRGQGRLSVKDLDETVDETFLGVTIHGRFHATGGQFGDLTTIHRTGDASMDIRGSRFIVSAPLGLDTLEIDFNQYSFDFLGIHSTGSIQAKCTRNSLTAVISVERTDGRCKVNLERASVTDLGGFDIHLSGVGDLNKLRNLLFSWILNQFNDAVRDQLNLHVEDAIASALEGADLCNKLPL